MEEFMHLKILYLGLLWGVFLLNLDLFTLSKNCKNGNYPQKEISFYVLKINNQHQVHNLINCKGSSIAHVQNYNVN